LLLIFKRYFRPKFKVDCNGKSLLQNQEWKCNFILHEVALWCENSIWYPLESWEIKILYNYCTSRSAIWCVMEHWKAILTEAEWHDQYCFSVLHNTSYCTKWSAVIVLLHLTFPIFFVYLDKYLGIVCCYTPRNEVVGGYTGFTMSVRPSVDKSYVVR
jgi:hypothetical protein